MRVVRIIPIFILAFIAALFFWIMIGSIDDKEFNDRGLLASLDKDFEDPDGNGYRFVEYMADEKFSFNFPDREYLASFRYYEKDGYRELVPLLALNGEHLSNIEKASNAPYFFITVHNDATELVTLADFVDGMRLLIVRSMFLADSGLYEEAISSAESALKFSQKIKTAENHWLISHMIGIRMQHEALLWIHHLSTTYPLDLGQHSRLATIVDDMPEYKDDGFKNVMSGEFDFGRRLTDEVFHRGLSGRLEDWKNGEDFWNLDFDDSMMTINYGYPDRILRFVRVVFPAYFLHRNQSLSLVAENFSRLAHLSEKPCDESVFLVKSLHDENYDQSFLEKLSPNSLGLKWKQEFSDFSNYYERRCFAHAYAGAVRVVIAAQMFKLQTGESPHSLDDLVPSYLPEIPFNPFDGGVLVYSGLDNGLYIKNDDLNGGQGVIYHHQCVFDKDCKSYPVFPLDSNLIIRAEISGNRVAEPEVSGSECTYEEEQ